MENHPKKEEDDIENYFEFPKDKENEVDEEEIDHVAKILAMKNLKNKGYINDAYDIMLDLHKN